MNSTLQRASALKRANHVRFYRTAVKAELRAAPDTRAGCLDVASLIEEPADELLAMTVLELLRAVPRQDLGLSKRILRRAFVSETATVGALTDRQRRALIADLGGDGG